jgi:hypothetical protein
VDEIPVDHLYPLKREADGTWTLRYVGPGSEHGGPREGWERHYRIMPHLRQRRDASSASVATESVYVIEQYDAASRSWKPWWPLEWASATEEEAEKSLPNVVRPSRYEPRVSWSGVVTTLREAAGRMLRGEMGRAGRDGRYAYLAYALLGAVLDLTPLQIRTLLDNHRRPRRRPKA